MGDADHLFGVIESSHVATKRSYNCRRYLNADVDIFPVVACQGNSVGNTSKDIAIFALK